MISLNSEWLRIFQYNYTVAENGCWLWQGTTFSDGYGRITTYKSSEGIHRTSYRLSKGEIPEGLFVLHKCDTPPCINPSCLFLGTKAQNNLDRALKHRSANRQGENNTDVKLSNKQVLEIRQKYWPQVYTLKMLAEEYQVSVATISLIVNRRTWRHI